MRAGEGAGHERVRSEAASEHKKEKAALLTDLHNTQHRLQRAEERVKRDRAVHRLQTAAMRSNLKAAREQLEESTGKLDAAEYIGQTMMEDIARLQREVRLAELEPVQKELEAPPSTIRNSVDSSSANPNRRRLSVRRRSTTPCMPQRARSQR